jgi:hypothetical protein
VISVSGLCNDLTTRPEKSYRLWCVVVCDLENSRMRRPWSTGGRSRQKQTKLLKGIWNGRFLAPLILNLRTRKSCVAMGTFCPLYLRRNRPILIIQEAVWDRAFVWTNWRRKYPLLMPGMEPRSFSYQSRNHCSDYAIPLLLVTTLLITLFFYRCINYNTPSNRSKPNFRNSRLCGCIVTYLNLIK